MSLDEKSPPQLLLSILLEHYENGRYDNAEKLALTITQEFPIHQFSWKILGAVLGQTDRKYESLVVAQKLIQLAPLDTEAHYNLAVILQELGKLKEAEVSYKQAIALKPIFVKAVYNLAVILQELGKLKEAEVSYRQSIVLKPDYVEAHSNLGTILKELGKLEEAEVSFIQAITLKPDFVEAYSNLGNTLKDLGRLEEAEASYKKAIVLKFNFTAAHYNLGTILKDLGRLEEAEACLRQAIELEPNNADAHSKLGNILYASGDKNSALKSIKKANLIDPKSKDYRLLLSVLNIRKERENTEESVENIITSDFIVLPPSKILLLKRSVEKELTAYLYSKKLLDLDKERDPSFGDTRGSKYDLFEDNHPTIQKLTSDLKNILVKVFKSDIFMYEAFFSIFTAGGGTIRHNHVSKNDKDSTFSLAKQKYSLVYYLSVGDQECADPGILKFYEPSEDILPSEDLITIFPADRYHSSFYGGNKDRVIVGVNFYTL